MIFKESFVMCAFLILWKLQILFHSGKIFKLNIFEFSRKILKYFLMYFFGYYSGTLLNIFLFRFLWRVNSNEAILINRFDCTPLSI